MNLRPLLLFVFLYVAVSSYSQDSLPPVYEIKVDTPVTALDNHFWQMAENRGKLGFNEIIKSGKFHSNNTKQTGVGYSGVKDYWVRLRIRNSTGKDQELIFGLNPRVFKTDLFVVRASGKIEHKKTGWGIPMNERDTFKTRAGILVALAAGEEITIYERLRLGNPDFYNELNIGFTFINKFLNDQYVREQLFIGDTRSALIAGLLIMAFFLNIFFFWIVREKLYLYYSLLLLLEGVWYLTMGTSMFFKNNPNLFIYFSLVFTHILFFFSVSQFVRHFLKTFIHYPKWDKFLVTLIVLSISFSLAQLYINTIVPFSWKGIPAGIGQFLFFIWMLSLFITFFLPKQEKDRFTNFSIIAAVPAFLTWSMIYGISSLYLFIENRYGIEKPEWIGWLNRNSFLIEMFCVAWFAILFTWILLQRYALVRKQLTQQALARERERSELMSQQKEILEKEVEARTAELKQTIEDLKSTQQQLIHSEKMASLGELTAGIAHEIQNPLNFVNNFSEVNQELISEMNAELDAGNINAARSISKNIEDNEEKIIVHGKRADAIVKSMLQHSRMSNGKKEPVDINALADEYLRLSYHGLRAKDKTFNAKFETDFDPEVGNIDVVTQDIGRVLLNLINNAFYAVTEKKRVSADPGYEPLVQVSTKKLAGSIKIMIRDNGNGIPKLVLDKIFQPFFTTKPAGEGTGLGLSLAYDIVTKGHGGDLKVVTREGEGTEFIIIIPSD